MHSLGNKIYVKRGEDFILKFGSEDTEPLVLQADIDTSKHYYFIVITLASTTYKQDGRHINTRWLDCSNVIKFTNTDIQYIGTSTTVGDTSSYSYVYCRTNSDGNKTYFYYDDDETETAYSFTFVVNYDTDESMELTDRRYEGTVRLVDGQPMSTYLLALANKYNLALSEETMSAAYQALLNINASELSSLDVSRPLNRLSTDIPLLKFDLIVEE